MNDNEKLLHIIRTLKVRLKSTIKEAEELHALDLVTQCMYDKNNLKELTIPLLSNKDNIIQIRKVNSLLLKYGFGTHYRCQTAVYLVDVLMSMIEQIQINKLEDKPLVCRNIIKKIDLRQYSDQSAFYRMFSNSLEVGYEEFVNGLRGLKEEEEDEIDAFLKAFYNKNTKIIEGYLNHN